MARPEDGALLTQDLVTEFLRQVFEKRLHPQDAADAIGVPYAQILAMRPSHPEIEAAWHAQKRGLTKAPRLVKQSSLEMKQTLLRRLMDHGFGDKIIRIVELADPETEEGRETIMRLLGVGVLRDLIPREASNEVSHIPADPYAGMDTNKLLELAESRMEETRAFLSQKERVRIAREEGAKALAASAKDAEWTETTEPDESN